MSNPLVELNASGQSPWIDFIRRTHMTSGEFGKLIDAGEIVGATSNPAIFEKAIGGSNDYDEQLKQLVSQGYTDPKKIFDELAIVDIQMAADILKPVFDRTNGIDGYISLEVSPGAASDTQATITEAKYLWGRVARPNVMIKVPATAEGVPAIEELIAAGLNINVTLIFSLGSYANVANAYITGLEKRVAAGQPIDHIASVASFFVSRVDTEIDKRLDALLAQTTDTAKQEQIRSLHGKAAVANAKLAYEIYQQTFNDDRFNALRAKGAKPQRCLWASTGTKNPAYSDVLYVDSLIGPETVNTMPPATIDAFRDHGTVQPTLAADVAAAHASIAQVESLGISVDEVTNKLLLDGIKLFNDPYNSLMEQTGKKVTQLRAEAQNGNGSTASFQDAVQKNLQSLDQAKAAERIFNKDYTFWKTDRAVGAKILDRLGWLDVAVRMENVVSQLSSFAHEVRVAGFKHAVLLGMGGSSLCPEVFKQTYGKTEGFPELHVLDSTDPAALLATENAIDVAHTLFIIASKSGSTLETNSHFKYFYDKVKAAKNDNDAGANFIAITDPNTSLEALASSAAFRATFRNPSDIGGRYSALSYFGLVPAAVSGYDLGAMLDSALAMMQACKNSVAAQNPGLTLGAQLGAGYQNGRNKLTIVASPPISSVGLWIEQLIAESTGKENRGIVPLAGEPLGTPDVYGQDRIFAYLRTTEGADPQQDAALKAIEEAGHPVLRFDLPTTYALAGEFYRWEMATAVAGHFLDINPFDEPNVQESKDNTKRILGDYEQNGKLATTTPVVIAGNVTVAAGKSVTAALTGATTLKQVVDAIIKLGQPGDYIATMAYVQPTASTDSFLERFRVILRDASHLATTVGYGPRFLHSTGQLHKGGANNGIFIQIVAADQQDAAIPTQNYSFGTLIHAQSLGDFESLQSHDRRVVRIDLGNDIQGGLAQLVER